MKSTNPFFLITGVILWSCSAPASIDQDIPPAPVIPSAKQIAYQQMEVIGFIHFGVNTFTDREWGTGKEEEDIFNPSALDASQWVQAAKTAGMGMLILTAKHHDGFCLWPSAFTDHSVKSSPWKEGNGDVVKELSEACAEADIQFGIYLSPWDMHESSYGTNGYNQYYLSQLEELLSHYGPISEVWMDGAKGKNARDMEYDFDAYRSLVYKLQPQALIFSDVGPDIRWIGNEHGIAGFTNWSMISTEGMEIGDANTDYLNTGDPNGKKWLVGECDVSIRPGWFYHVSQDSLVKSPDRHHFRHRNRRRHGGSVAGRRGKQWDNFCYHRCRGELYDGRIAFKHIHTFSLSITFYASVRRKCCCYRK